VTVTATSVANTTQTGSLTLTVPAKLAITTTSTQLTGAVGAAYSAQLTITGGISPYKWTVDSSTPLPTNWSLSSTGLLTGPAPTNGQTGGTYTFDVTDSGTPTPLTTSLQLTVTITQAPAIIITGVMPATGTYGTAYSGSAGATGGAGALGYSYTGSLPPGLLLNTSTGVLAGTPTAPGKYSFAVQAADSFGDTPATQGYTITIGTAAQTITFANPGTQTVATPLTLSATASSGLAVSFASTTPSVCTVSGTAATMVASGTCTVQATQPGNTNYAAATAVSQTFTVNGEAQTITFAPPGVQNVGTPLTLSATASSNLAVNFTSTTTSICTVSGTAATMVAIGTCTIQATQPGDSTYAAATPVSQTFTVNGEAQTITFASPGTQTVGTPLTLSATASSGLGVTFTSGTSSVCTVAGTAATMLISGTCIIDANQAGNTTYAAAPQVAQSFSVNGEAQSITFANPGTQTVGTPLTLSATASSGLGVTFASTTSSVCTVSGTAATMLTSGTCTIQATQPGNTSYAAATAVSQSFSVNAESQTITFANPGTQAVGTPLTLSATASSGLGVTFASTTSSVCTVSGTTATMLIAGTCTIQASQAGNSSYLAATPVSQSFTVNLESQTITFSSPGTQAVGTPLTLSATASSNLAVSYDSTTPAVCTVSGTSATMLISGTCTIEATQAGNASYAAAPTVSQTFTVNGEAQTITFAPIAGQAVGTPLALTATASSGLGVTFASLTSSVCTVTGTSATFSTTGTCTIQATQAGNASYAAATPVSQSFTVSAESQTITFTTITTQTVGTPLTLAATASSSLGVTFASLTSSVCTVSGTTATMLTSGTCTIQATQTGNSSYAPATPVSQSFTVNAAAQTITFTNPGTQTVGTPLALSASASSGLAVSYTSTTTSVCTVSGTTATMLIAGSCTIQAAQAGNSSYLPATSVSQTFTVNLEAQTITFANPGTQTVATPLTLSATASSNLAVTFASTTPLVCTVSGTAATMVTSGTCTIQATQPGNASYAAATMVSQSFTVNGEAQTITFATPGAQNVGTPLALSATATSNLAVTFASTTTSVCTVSGTAATMVSTGTCTIQATQTGNSTYAAAPMISQSFTVNGEAQTIIFNTPGAQTVGTPLTLSATASSGLAVTFASTTSSVCTVSGTAATMLTSGTCTIQATQAGNTTYAAAPMVSQSFTVNLEAQTITFGNPGAQTVGTPLTLSATASSGLAVTYVSESTSVCTVSGTTTTMLTTGTCVIQANQAGNTSYAAASSVMQSFAVNGEVQTITFNTIPTQNVGTPLTLSATASSGLAVTYASTTLSICTVSGTTVSLLATGTCSIQATQTGNSTYAAATMVTQSFTVNAATQTINFANPGAQNVGTPLTLSATASSGLTVIFNSQTTSVCTVSGTSATMLTTGTCTIQATQPGNTNYVAATPVSQSFTVYGPTQTISFANPGAQDVGTQLALSATASSGLTVSFASLTTSVCSVSGTTATMLTAGTCTIQATQPGNSSYAAASPVSQNFTVYGPLTFVINPNPLPSGTVGQNYNGTITVSGGSGSGYAFSVMVGSTLTPVPAYQQGQLPVANGIVVSMQGTTELIISGTPGAATPVALDVTVTDSTNGSLTQNYTINILNSNAAYSVSGTVTYTGSKVGWVYVGLVPTNCGNCSVSMGTAINATSSGALASGKAFTINGVPSGTYSLQAWMDNTSTVSGEQMGGYGAPNASNPTGSYTSNVTVTNSGLSGQSFTLSDPGTVSLGTATPTFDASQGEGAFSGGAVLYFDPICNGSGCNNGGVEMPNSYNVQWSLSSSFGTIAGSQCFPANGGQNPWIVSPISGSGPYFFRAAGVVGSCASGTYGSYSSPSSAITIAAHTGDNAVSGTVKFGGTATGPLYVGFYNYNTGAVYGTVVGSKANPPTSPASYSVNVPTASTYYFFGVVDQKNNGLMNAPGNISNTNNGNGIGYANITGPTTTENLDLTPESVNSVATVRTNVNKTITSSGTDTSYNVGFNVYGALKLPVAVQLVSGTNPNVVMPSDIATGGFYGNNIDSFSFWPNFNGNAPQVGDSYSLKVTYSDATSETLTAAVGTVLNAFATNLSPQGSGVSITPNFSWVYPANASNYNYEFQLSEGNNGSEIWQIPTQHSKTNGFSSSISPAITWGVDPTNSGDTPSVPSLDSISTYNWSIIASDTYGNGASVQVSFETIAATLALPSSGLGNAMAGQPYGATLNASGGSGSGYSFTVNGTTVPTNMSYVSITNGDGLTAASSGGNTLWFAGTPTTAESLPISVTVTDSASNTASQNYTFNVLGTPSGVNNANLQGIYVCKTDGFNDSDSERWTSLSTFQASGSTGSLTNGVWDMNGRDNSSGEASGTMTGTYSIGSDNNGVLTTNSIQTSGGSGTMKMNFAIALSNATSPAQQFRMVQIDDVGSSPAGMHSTANCYLATTSAFATSTVSGKSFAFGVQGENGNGVPKAYVGRMTFSTESATGGTGSAAGGSITSGYIDGRRVDQTSDNGGSYSTSSSYTIPDSNGRFTFTMIPYGKTSGQSWVAYIIDANRMFLLETAGDTGLLAGDMRTQLQSANTASALLNGSFVIYNQSYQSTNGTVTGFGSQVYQGTGDGTGNMTMNQSYEDYDGAYSVGSDLGTGTPSLDASNPGRATISGNGTTYLYFFNNTSAFELNLSSGYLDSGWMEPQTQTTLTAGTYMLGGLPRPDPDDHGTAGEVTLNSNGSVSGAATSAGQNKFTWDSPFSTTYSWDSSAPGTGTFLVASPMDISCAVISSTKVVCTVQADSNPGVTVFQR
jgi:hypothetical protein